MADDKSLGNEGLSYLLSKIKTYIAGKTVLLTAEEYEALEIKDESILYCIVEEE